MPFRRRFDCLWCGQPHDVRSVDDLEGWASLCPDCIGRADDNGFLRARVRAALTERAAVTATPASPSAIAAAPDPALASVPAPALAAPVDHPASATSDDWYLRRGPFSRGPLIDGPWQMELDEVTRWLDAQAISGVVVELAPGSGWWSPLLADKGELWLYDSDEGALEEARRRLVAHGLLAHLHLRDPLSPADKPADVVFAAYLLGEATDASELQRRLDVVRGWLKPGGAFLFVEAAPVPAGRAEPVDGPRRPLWPRDPGILRAALLDAGLQPDEVITSHSAFVMGRATRPI